MVAPASLQIVKEHLLEAIIVQEMKEIRYMLACACIQASCTVHGAVTPSPLTECQLCTVMCCACASWYTERRCDSCLARSPQAISPRSVTGRLFGLDNA